MKILYCFLITCFLVFCCSCSQKTSDNNSNAYPVLKVSLKETPTSFYDLFEKAELIPLETNDESLIKRIKKIVVFENQYYVFDEELASLFIFDNTGKYMNKIARIGQGPGEYTYIYDFYLNEDKQTISMLSPYGALYTYDLDTRFMMKFDLPHNPLPRNYQKMEFWTKGSYIFWSLVMRNEYSLNIVSVETGDIIKSFYDKENPILRTYSSQPFFRDNKDNLYFSRPFVNEVYQITENGLEVAYKWDFGSNSIDINNYKFPNTSDLSENIEKFYTLFINGDTPSIPFHYLAQNQTDKYYYTRLRFAHNIRKNLFYDKTDNQYMLFEKTTEGILFDPILFTDEYIIFSLEPDKKEMIEPVLSKDDKDKLSHFETTDNPWLVKCIFKK